MYKNWISYSNIYFFIILMRIVSGTSTIKVLTELKNVIRFDKKMPSVYINNNLNIDEKMYKSLYCLEHVYPQSFLDKLHVNDMHNVVRTINELNMCRSNYRYIGYVNNKDDLKDENVWKELSFDNFVNHKKKLFIPNSSSRGFIARTLLYMKKEYGYNIEKVLDTETLVSWFYNYPPTLEEKYHNKLVIQIQKNNNMFISKYKNKNVRKFVDNL